jgi:hypothetical protein
MKNNLESTGNGSELDRPPFLYEIRVKGRLSSEQWMSWFDDLTVSTASGESTLRGRVPDHAALYGLLARLRDLAIPLVAVKVLDAEAQLKLSQQSRRYDLAINLVLVAIYLALLGGLSAITVFVAHIINVALALTLLFALLGGLGHVFWLWSGQAPWRWITYVTWPAATITFLVFLPISGVVPPALGIAIMLVLGAGGLIYLVYYLRRRAENIHNSLAQGEFPPRAARSVDGGRAAETPRRDPTSGEPIQ